MTVETIEFEGGLRARVEFDQDAGAPHENMDMVATVVYRKSSRYRLGTEGVSEDELDEIGRRIHSGDLVGVPVYAYVHSGVLLKAGWTNPFSCPWDSGQSGWMYCTREKAVQEWGNKVCTPRVREKAIAYMKVELQTLEHWINGETYGYVLERVVLDEDDEIADTQELDSCWGYYGWDDVAEAAREAAQYHMEAEVAPT